MHLAKKGLRVLGVAESFRGREDSTLAGVVMRRDRIIDGFGFAEVTVGGMDATNAVISLFKAFEREDVNLIMLSGCVIAWYNIISPEEVWRETGVPVVVVTYEDSEGLKEEIGAHFPGDEERLEAYRRLGARTPRTHRTGYTVYLRAAGIDVQEAGALVEGFTLEGKVPEPLRTARLAARALMRHRYGRR
ncbi:endonuclease V-like protein UPF0215 family [Methanofollis sp. W23]|uniref:endonuclease dU n=1 Tax=Methanofollis sp. W23 TaxID=2817849 RepID=UPI001AE32F1A|nr:DUF99 family protein [Methanofollis sp. W23]MBP2145644.1 endonuclease V-like protein UPF0215 family [Methanofollis sp. W23]